MMALIYPGEGFTWSGSHEHDAAGMALTRGDTSAVAFLEFLTCFSIKQVRFS
jgi:hypothetical protein